jgi:hypothetical protein
MASAIGIGAACCLIGCCKMRDKKEKRQEKGITVVEYRKKRDELLNKEP